MGLAILAGSVTFGLVGASAATLGGITSKTLGADATTVASCDTDGVALAFTNAYVAASGTYQTTAIRLSGINPACAGKALSLTVRNASNAAIGTGSIAALTTSTAQTVALATPVSAATVAGVAIVITG
jgi:hypothetical protein